MQIGLHDAEKDHMKNKSFPNYALMKLSAYHKSKGNTVEWWKPKDGRHYDIVYSSKIFDFTPENPNLPESTVRGGTGYGLYGELPHEIDCQYPDYSIYPDCDYAIGYITRGCPNRCGFCVVGIKEGDIRPYADWRDIVRQDTKKLVLMDNNILACEYGINQLTELSLTDYRLDLNQGIDARLVDNRIAEILSKIKWLKYIRFSCDSKGQIDCVINTAETLISLGIAPSRIFVYLLVTQDVIDAAERVEQLKRLKSITIYAQPERNIKMGVPPPTVEQKEFCGRYIYGGAWRKESWWDYCEKRKSYSKRRYVGAQAKYGVDTQ